MKSWPLSGLPWNYMKMNMGVLNVIQHPEAGVGRLLEDLCDTDTESIPQRFDDLRALVSGAWRIANEATGDTDS